MMSRPSRRDFLTTVAAGATAAFVTSRFGFAAEIAQAAVAATGPAESRPNILFCLADDWNWPHSALKDVKVIQTPTYDRVCREGVVFTNVFVTSPSCTPSRASILTGQWHWRLEEAANLAGELNQNKFPVYPNILGKAGYHVGMMGKGPDGRVNNAPPGPRYKDFAAFLQARPKGTPFVFWFGSHDPHRPYAKGLGVKSGMKLEDVQVPACLPDSPEVRSDLCDYYWAIQRFDTQVGEMMKMLEDAGELDNTIVVVTGDNGLPFPRCKSNLYDTGTKAPMAIRWGNKVKPGRVVNDFVSLSDLAPTFLEAGGLKPIPDMTAKTLMPLLLSDKSGQIDPKRDYMLTGKERHTHAQEKGNPGGYPCRAIRTNEYLYIHNFKPERWPAGVASAAENFSGKAYHDIDASPSKAYMIAHKDDPKVEHLFELGFGKRPAEELYDLTKAPDQLNNVADKPEYAEIKKNLSKKLMVDLVESQDPRVLGDGDKFDHWIRKGD